MQISITLVTVHFKINFLLWISLNDNEHFGYHEELPLALIYSVPQVLHSKYSQRLGE